MLLRRSSLLLMSAKMFLMVNVRMGSTAMESFAMVLFKVVVTTKLSKILKAKYVFKAVVKYSKVLRLRLWSGEEAALWCRGDFFCIKKIKLPDKKVDFF